MLSGGNKKVIAKVKSLCKREKLPAKKKNAGCGKRKYIVTVENSCLLKKAKSAKSECFVFKNC